jgi:hypothetical protein
VGRWLSLDWIDMAAVSGKAVKRDDALISVNTWNECLLLVYPKCTTLVLDILRLVYNGRSCGLNNVTWAPNFWLPTAWSAIRLLDFNYYSVDLDLGEMFLNVPLHHILQPTTLLWSGCNSIQS